MILLGIPLESLGIGPKLLGWDPLPFKSTPLVQQHLVVGQDGARASVQVCLGPTGSFPFEKREQLLSFWKHQPIGSIYGIYANIGGILMVNVTIYGIHGSYGQWKITIVKSWECPYFQPFLITREVAE